MKAIFSYYAKKEFEDAYDYYKIQSPGLEDQFKEEVKHAISRIKAFPRGWAIERSEIRIAAISIHYILHESAKGYDS